jgi:hypothetical protein
VSFGQALGGEIAVAGVDDAHSPNTALVTLDIDGDKHLIDFLGSMKGFSPQELERVRQWAIPLRVTQGTPRPLYVMHPVHCLEAQLENVYGRALNRRDDPGGERYVGRVQLAVEACRRVGERYLDEGQPRSALRLAEKVHELSLLPSAIRARFEDHVLIERGIPDGPKMPEEFLKKRLPQLREELTRVIKRHQTRKP